MNRGFTLIELLVAMIILMIVMIGFLTGILNYIKYSLDTRMKGVMDKLVKDWSGYLDSVPYSSFNSTSPSFGDATCDFSTNRCSFENTDSDGDNIPDFYDPYNGNNNSFKDNYTSTASWLYISPSNNPLGSSSPPTSYAMGGRRVFVGITVANVVIGGREIGKAFGITSWYFSPMNGNYKYESTLLIKRKP